MDSPAIFRQEPMKLVGLEYIGSPTGDEIPKLWQAFMPRMSEVRRIKDTFGFARPAGDGSGGVRYLVGSQVADFDHIPDGMVGREVAGGPYAIIQCPGLERLSETMRWFYDEWIPGSPYSAGEGVLEYYPPTFPMEPQFELRFAVVPRG